MQKGIAPIALVIIIAVVVIAVGGYVALRDNTSETPQITPAPTGTPPVATPTPSPTTTPTPDPSPGVGYVAPQCKVGGCSGTVCQNKTDEDAVTTCEWRESYACYRTARCEPQANGRCGWTQTAGLRSCLQRAGEN